MAFYNPSAITVTTSATLLFTASLGTADAMYGADVLIHNTAGETMYCGASDVTSAKGIPVTSTTPLSMSNLQPGEDVYAITASSTATARVLASGC